MKALILNSGMGTRMGSTTDNKPKCMSELLNNETIVSRQLRQLCDNGIEEIVMTTGRHADSLVEYCNSLKLPLKYTFVYNPDYVNTNYIYSIYLAKEFLEEDIILMHGDLVFEANVLEGMIAQKKSCMAVSSTVLLPEKDFKAVINSGIIEKVGVNYFDNAIAAQPLYKLNKMDWMKWLTRISEYCEEGKTKVYAENALNELNGNANIYPYDVRDLLCSEVDNIEDLTLMIEKLMIL